MLSYKTTFAFQGAYDITNVLHSHYWEVYAMSLVRTIHHRFVDAVYVSKVQRNFHPITLFIYYQWTHSGRPTIQCNTCVTTNKVDH